MSAGPLAAVRENLRHARLGRAELAGSLGDLGTFLPLLVAMSARNGLDFASSLLFAGLFSIATGMMFRIPLAVQPMKAIAAVAITQGLTAAQIGAAGAIVSAVVLALGVTGLIDWLNRLVPRSVVKGLQLSLGLSLLMKGAQMVSGTGVAVGPDSYATGVVAGLLVLALVASRRVPAALVLFVMGIGLALWKDPGLWEHLRLGPWLPGLSAPSVEDFQVAGPQAALPQIPLTTLNSVVAVCALAADLFPSEARRVTGRRVAVSVGLINLVGVWFGAMPMCHGAGGLAGQYRFGARTNGSILFLGVMKAGLAVLLGASLMPLCAAFPASVLGVMLVVSGIELGMVARDHVRGRDAVAMLLTAGLCLGLNNIAAGFAIGLVAAWLMSLRREQAAEGAS